MKRRQYLTMAGVSALPIGLSSLLTTQDNGQLSPEEFKDKLPTHIDGRQIGKLHEGETNEDKTIITVAYQYLGNNSVGLQYIQDNEPWLICVMYTTHYYAESMDEAIQHLSTFFNKVEVKHSELHEGKLEYITYTIGNYTIRTKYDFRPGYPSNQVWVNGELRTFEDQLSRNEFVNEQVQSRIQE